MIEKVHVDQFLETGALTYLGIITSVLSRRQFPKEW